MKDIIEKLNNIKKLINSEKGEIKFFCLIERTDDGSNGRWDILFSADWIDESNKRENLIDLINKLKEEFGGNLDFLSKIVLFTPNELFIQQLAKVIIDSGNKKTEDKIENLKIDKNITLKGIYIIDVNFMKEDFKKLHESEAEAVIHRDQIFVF